MSQEELYESAMFPEIDAEEPKNDTESGDVFNCIYTEYVPATLELGSSDITDFPFIGPIEAATVAKPIPVQTQTIQNTPTNVPVKEEYEEILEEEQEESQEDEQQIEKRQQQHENTKEPKRKKRESKRRKARSTSALLDSAPRIISDQREIIRTWFAKHKVTRYKMHTNL